MAQRKKLMEDLEALNTLKNLAESYEEVAVVRMQKIKDSVLKTRDYLSDLSDVFVDLKSSYERELKELLMKRKNGGLAAILPNLQKNGKTVYVYLSSNGRLYGSVTQKTFRLFAQDLRKAEADVIIVGSAGKEMYDTSSIKKPYEYVDIPDTSVDVEHIKTMMSKLMPYEKVFVYYGKFGNVVTQSAIASSISGEEIFEAEVIHPTPREDKFIFEPTLEKIFSFFETQIMANLFSQSLLENQLARHASRVSAMEEALVNIEQESIKLNQMRTRMKHQMQNKKQLETISGLALWS